MHGFRVSNDLNWSPAIHAIQEFDKPGCFKRNVSKNVLAFALAKFWNLLFGKHHQSSGWTWSQLQSLLLHLVATAWTIDQSDAFNLQLLQLSSFLSKRVVKVVLEQPQRCIFVPKQGSHLTGLVARWVLFPPQKKGTKTFKASTIFWLNFA